MAPWFPEMMIPVATTTGIAAPGVIIHQATTLWPPPGLRDRESSSQPSETVDLLCCCWTPWWQEQKLSCHLQYFTALSGTGFHTMPSVLHPLHGVFVGVTDPCGRQPPGQVPAVEDKGWTTGEPGLGPLHHPK